MREVCAYGAGGPQHNRHLFYIYHIEAKKGLVHVSESLPIDPIDAISALQFVLFYNGTSILFNSIFARGLSFPYFFISFIFAF